MNAVILAGRKRAFEYLLGSAGTTINGIFVFVQPTEPLWGDKIHKCLSFGHANLEFITHPLYGLTGKSVGITVDSGFGQLPFHQAAQCARTTNLVGKN